PGPRLQAELLGPLRRHPEHGGGAVGDLRTVAGGMDAFGQDGLELAESVERRLAHALIPPHDLAPGLACAALRLARGASAGFEGEHLALETAFVPGPRRLLLRPEGEAVDVVAGDAAPLGDALGGRELVGRV